jgi:tRNA (uracil-5-)-methyltransferase
MALFDGAGSEDSKWAVVVPFAHPGDLVRLKVAKHGRLHSTADLLEIVEYSETYRGGEGDRRKYPQNGCKYFGSWCVIVI